MQGIILAAGMGKRLQRLTENNTKCMVKVNEMTMIERCLRILDKKHLSRIVIVVGYQGENLIDFIGKLNISTPICYINNTIYDKTNNIYSLALAKEYLRSDDTLLLESDLVFEENIIDELLSDKRETLALVDKFESWMDGTCMEIDDDDCIVDFIPGKHLKFSEKEKYYKTVNIYKFSKHFSEDTYVPFLSAYEKAMGENEYYESVIKLIAMLETKEIRAKRLCGQKWYEIDNAQDLDIAESIFADNKEEKFRKISERYGGYWRYPKMIDFCYLVNPYYPSEKMIEEIKSNFEILLTQYPSGMRVNSLLASNNFGINENNIIVGNGAAELIKAVMDRIEGKIGIIYPTFQEYPNRYDKKDIVAFNAEEVNGDFRYMEDDVITYFNDKCIDNLIIINPDNPSGNYISYNGLLKLIDWCKDKKIKFILDESFVDFVEIDEKETDLSKLTLLKQEILNRYKGLYVIKSISKSYGVPGLRLGIMASSDSDMIFELKKDVAIWNINSFAEFYLQIAEKYKKDYIAAIEKFSESRRKFIMELKEISWIRVLPSQANYVMCELIDKKSAEICVNLLDKNIFIKDLSKKICNGKQYIRIAIRKECENKKLIDALKTI
ncbi:hemolysin erythrocyte lysis protein [Clostridium sp. CAG:253]|nr:hemolysin erythrocyte lysis protein [Clostridium sp. CAG:253]